MPIIRKKQEFWITKDVASRVYYDVRYQGPGYNQTAFFAAIPHEQGSIRSMVGIEYCEGSKGKNNGAYGFKAETEREAVNKLKKFMTDDFNDGAKKEKMIFIDNDAESEGHHFHGERTQKRTVTFSFRVVVKVTRKDKVKYFDLNSAGIETSYEASERGVSIVPWTEEREASCNLILALFDRLQDRVNKIVSTDAAGMLDKNIGLLLTNQ